MGDIEQEINLDEITDESVLQNLLDQTEDIDDRQAIRARIQELRAATKARREVKTNVTKVTDSREERLQKRQKDALEQKQRTMAMYDSMARSAPAGGDKKMDIGIYRTSDATPPGTPGLISGIRSSDLVEDALRQRQRAAEERKKRILAAYEAAARGAPAGTVREVNFEAFKKADVSDYTPAQNEPASTFGMSGGIPKVTKAFSSQPGTPISPGFPGGIQWPKGEPEMDAMERMIRARQQEAEERKRRTLAAYDIVAKQGGAGPKLVCLEEFKNMDVNNHTSHGRKYSAAAGFTGGVHRA